MEENSKKSIIQKISKISVIDDDNKIKEETIEELIKKEDCKKKQIDNRNSEILLLLRKKYARRIFNFICKWSLFVGIVIILSGFNVLNFNLADSVLIALMTTTFAQVLGLMIAVLYYIFPAFHVGA